MAENNAAAADNNDGIMNAEEEDRASVPPQPTHEIPTSDNDQGSSSFDHSAEYGYYDHPHHGLPPPPLPSSFYSPPPLDFPPPMMPPIAPMMLPPVTADNCSNCNNNNEQQLDFTRQYYEARMREHAMQYANAAAGAAWAAARMANSFNWQFQQQQQQQGGSYATANNCSGSGGYPQYTPECHHPSQLLQQQPPQRRKLWKPPKTTTQNDHGNKSNHLKQPPTTTDANDDDDNNHHYREIKHHQLSKKRESGNDSISSLGTSESHHYYSQQHLRQADAADTSNNHNNIIGSSSIGSNNNQSKKKKKGKKNQRRRFNDDELDEELAPPPASSLTTDTTATAAAVGYSNERSNVDRVYNNYNQRQNKRGLQHHQHQQHQHVHSSKSSFSSHGNSSSGGGGGGGNNNNRKKKNRSIPSQTTTTNSNNNTIQGVFLGGLIGKTGVSALHELCHKYRWEKPVYTLIESDASVGRKEDGDDNTREVVTTDDVGGVDDNSATVAIVPNANNNNNRITTNNPYQEFPHGFIISVHVNKIELGRGRGDSKTAAKQDGSRKALAALVPGVVFDPNGILLDIGGGGRGNRSQSHDRMSSGSGGVITSMEELGPHLASQLAIGGNDTPNNNGGSGHHHQRCSRPSSPDHSETSSISTSVSMTKMTRVGSVSSIIDNVGIGEGGGVINIGRCSSNIYPCASTTSGVSSASEVEDGEDENAYYASRGASVCSTLLQAMWQIDDRIRQPPSYAFDIYPISSATKDSGGGGIEQPNKRRKSGGGPSSSERSKKPAAHRGTYQCTATLNLYFRMEEGKDNSASSLMESWESPLEYLQTRETKFSSSSNYANVVSLQESRKRKDSFASQATPSPDRHRHFKGAGNDDEDDDEPENTASSKRQKVDEFIKHTLESIATGSTKRESKHKASAKLLTLLFPECSSLIEVKASAEAARECYAATKAMSSQTKRAKLSDYKGSPERRGVPAAERSGSSNDLLAKSDSFVSVAGLSLSEEPVDDESKRITWCDSTKEEEPTTGFDVNFACEVDSALKSLREQEEEPSVDVGRIVLCRAQPDDAEFIYALLNKANESNRYGGEIIANTHATSTEVESREDVSDTIYGSDSIFLLLSRAVSSHEPLGCAILTFSSSSDEEGGRSQLVLQNIGHEEHLPRERFIECLEAFASKLETNLDTSSIFNDNVRLSSSPDEIRKCLIRQQLSKGNSACSSTPSYQDQEVIRSHSSHSLLQSVKEEDSEDADDCSDGDNVEKEVESRTQHDTEVNGKRPLRSKRRREMHDRQKH